MGRRRLTQEDVEKQFEIVSTGSWHNQPCYISYCPQCKDTSGHLYINTVTRTIWCARCGYISDFEITEDTISTLVFKTKKKQEQKPSAPVWHKYYWDAHAFDKKTIFESLPLQYLTGRGIGRDLAVHLGIRYTNFGPWSGRVIIPHFEKGSLEFAVARTYTGEKPKYRNAPGSSGVGRGLLYAPEIGAADVAVVVEGVFDAITVSQHTGFQGLATYGKTLNKKHLANLERKLVVHHYHRLIYFPDKTGITWAEIAANLALLGVVIDDRKLFVYLPRNGKDANELGSIDFEESISSWEFQQRRRSGEFS